MLLSVMAMLCLNFATKAQGPVTEIKPLKVGDKLSETFWKQEHNIYASGQTTKQSLAKYKGKLLILDFWATWCGSCVSKLPMIDSLQNENEQLKIVLVNSTKVKEKPNAIQSFFASHPIGGKLPMGTIICDTLLTQMFPFKVLPHLIWIDAGGMVVAITTYQHFNREIIANVLMQNQRNLKNSSHEKH